MVPGSGPKLRSESPLTEAEQQLKARWQSGCRNGNELWRYLRSIGIRVGASTVRRHIAAWRALESGGSVQGSKHPPACLVATPSPRCVRWWLLRTADELSIQQAKFVQILVAAKPVLATGQRLANEFGKMVRTGHASAFEPWMNAAAESNVPEFREFVVSLKRDAAAVKAALMQPWSNGQTEGQVNKLKMLKRQMYGRASIALLRQRLLCTG
jgi:transposase